MKMLNYTKKIVKFGQILRLKHKKRLFFSQNFDIFLQNLVSGPHKRHDGGQNYLIFQKIQNLSNLVKLCKKSQFLIIFPPKNALLWPKSVLKFKFFRPNPPFEEKISKFSPKTPPEVTILVKNGPPR